MFRPTMSKESATRSVCFALILLTTACDGPNATPRAQMRLQHSVCDGTSWTPVSSSSVGPMNDLASAALGDLVHNVRLEGARTLVLGIHDAARLLEREVIPFDSASAVSDIALAWVGTVLHLTALDSGGVVSHGSYENGSWSAFRQVDLSTSVISAARQIAVTTQGDLMHLCLLDSRGQLFHTLHDGMSWLPARSVSAHTGFSDLTCAAYDKTVHLLALGPDGSRWQFLREGDWRAGVHIPLRPERAPPVRLKARFSGEALYLLEQTKGGGLVFSTWKGGFWTDPLEVPTTGRVAHFALSSYAPTEGARELLFLCTASPPIP